jgi:alkylation response protein AidB-like acyl-CoA dehydrogenase
MSVTAVTSFAPDEIVETVLGQADRVAEQLGRTAAERDDVNATPRDEIELLRSSDLLQVQEPVEHGGSGFNYAQAVQITRRIARGDTSIAHLIGYHFIQNRVATLFGTPAQADAQSRRNGIEKLFWGGIQNPRGSSGLVLNRDGDGFRLNGTAPSPAGPAPVINSR